MAQPGPLERDRAAELAPGGDRFVLVVDGPAGHDGDARRRAAAPSPRAPRARRRGRARRAVADRRRSAPGRASSRAPSRRAARAQPADPAVRAQLGQRRGEQRVGVRAASRIGAGPSYSSKSDEHLPDRGIVAERRDQLAQRLDVVPEQRRVVERVGRGRRVGQRPLEPRDVAGASAGRSTPSVAARSAAIAESPPEHVMTATPRGAVRAGRPGPAASRAPSRPRAGRAGPRSTRRRTPRTARGRRAGRRRSRPCGPRRPRAPAADVPAFSTATRTPARAQRSSAAHQRSPSPSSSTYSATRPHAVALGDRAEEVGGVEHGLVAARHDRVQAQPAARRQRVHRDVAALRDHGDRAGLRPPRARRPTARRGRAARRSRCRSARTPASPPRRPRAAPAGRRGAPPRSPAANTTAPPHPSSRARATTSGASAAGSATTTASGHLRAARRARRYARTPCTASRRGLTANTRPRNRAGRG